jgi:hypothetical protein
MWANGPRAEPRGGSTSLTNRGLTSLTNHGVEGWSLSGATGRSPSGAEGWSPSEAEGGLLHLSIHHRNANHVQDFTHAATHL